MSNVTDISTFKGKKKSGDETGPVIVRGSVLLDLDEHGPFSYSETGQKFIGEGQTYHNIMFSPDCLKQWELVEGGELARADVETPKRLFVRSEDFHILSPGDLELGDGRVREFLPDQKSVSMFFEFYPKEGILIPYMKTPKVFSVPHGHPPSLQDVDPFFGLSFFMEL